MLREQPPTEQLQHCNLTEINIWKSGLQTLHLHCGIFNRIGPNYNVQIVLCIKIAFQLFLQLCVEWEGEMSLRLWKHRRLQNWIGLFMKVWGGLAQG